MALMSYLAELKTRSPPSEISINAVETRVFLTGGLGKDYAGGAPYLNVVEEGSRHSLLRDIMLLSKSYLR